MLPTDETLQSIKTEGDRESFYECDVDQGSERSQPWLLDGNIIIATDTRLFRVHRGVLCLHSQIFKDMFSSSQPDAALMVDDCPVVHLPDSGDDMYHVLQALYDRSYSPAYSDKLPFEVTAAFLRLGKKYMIDHLYKEAKDRLASNFPTTLVGWDLADARCSGSWSVSGWTHHALTLLTANLARETQLLSLLPAALYSASTLCTARELVHGVDDCTTGAHVLLCPENRDAVVVAHDALRELAVKTYGWLMRLPPACRLPGMDGCLDKKRTLLISLFYPKRVCTPLDEWDDAWEDRLCSECAAEAKRLHEAGRRYAWSQLPQVYGLPKWADLKD
ncbi:hypothetical protein CONPUDRAFT_167140 [Coniophora puteana RWD-64-598 SS2]|uniref:BTB domain-containing protein n=1 Tax=Coniophora puteana (strain RWD-64-598) TaxID=741705 RepID=A0A5M3ML45_CONPW|nr:uncharacterized protein CONPUDRAFT_167140 [Coniophora puteana RWD-64-598 SS2]EIW79385.1 hypothetical protein CONPUDRAFT_167140 [Coniophora puteana RWD-64-598 SS2]